MRKTGLVRSSSVMVAAIGVTKFLGIISIIPINQLLGNVGQGYYSTAYNLYTILMALATSGLPTALSKLIAERTSMNHHEEIEKLYRYTVKLVCSFAVMASLLVWFGAPYYASLVAIHANHQQISDMVVSIRALAPAVLVVPLESALRGYLQGFQEVKGPALSQAVEQLFRVTVAVFGTLLMIKIGKGIAVGAAAATFGAFIGALAGIIVLSFAVLPIRRRNRKQLTRRGHSNDKQLRRLLYSVALPISIGSLVVPISSNVDSLTVVNFLTHFAGQTFNQAQAGFGVLSRQAQNLVQLPLSFTVAVGFSIMPAISEAASIRDEALIQSNIISSLRMMFFVNFPAAVFFVTLARPIEYLLSDSYDGSLVIATISFMCVFSSMELMSTYILQGLGNLYLPVRNMVLGITLKAILNVLLIILLKSVLGAALATIFGYVLSSALNILAVRKYSGVKFSIARLAFPFLLASVPVCIELILVNWVLFQLVPMVSINLMWIWSVVHLLISSITGAALYFYIALRMRLLRPEQPQSLPLVGTWLSRFI